MPFFTDVNKSSELKGEVVYNSIKDGNQKGKY